MILEVCDFVISSHPVSKRGFIKKALLVKKRRLIWSVIYAKSPATEEIKKSQHQRAINYLAKEIADFGRV